MNKRVNIFSCRTHIILFAQALLCPNEIFDPFREGCSAEYIKQRREFQMSMEVYQSRHQDHIPQMHHAMLIKFMYYPVFSADCQNGPLIDRYCTVIN